MENNLKVAGLDFIEIDDNIYVTCSSCNAICEVNKRTKKTKIIYIDENKGLTIPHLWTKIGYKEDKIAIAPFNRNHMTIIDRKTHVTLFEMPIEEKENMEFFFQVITYDKYFYFMGYRYPAILKVNVDTSECEYLTQWVSELYPEGVDVSKGDYYIADGFVQLGSEFYFCTGKDAKLLKLDCSTDEIQLIQIPCDLNRFYAISGEGDEIWITDFSNVSGSDRIVLWNRITNGTKIIKLNCTGLWNAPIFYGEDAYLFPVNVEGKVLKVNRNSLDVCVFEDLDYLFRDKYGRIANVMTVKQHDKEVTFIRRPDYTWFTYNFETGELKEEIYTIDDSEFIEKYNAEKNACYDKIYEKAINVGDVIYEEDIPLEKFLERI